MVNEIMESILVVFTVCLTLAFLMSEFAYRLRYPRVVGQILAGVILGLPFIKGGLFGEEGVSFIGSLADLAVVFLMLLVGTEIKIHELRRASKKAVVLAFFGYVIPFTLGFLLMEALGYATLTAVIVGICLAISAEAITLDILMEYKLLKTRLGTTIMEAGMIDDFLGVLSLVAVIGVVQGGGVESLRSMPGEFVTFIIISYLLGIMVLPKAAKAVWKEKSEAAVFSLAIIFGLIIVLLSSYFQLNAVIGAFVAGLIIQLTIKNRLEEKEIVESLNIVTFGLVIPFFFIYTGMKLDIFKLLDGGYLIVLLTLIALFGKLAAAHIMGAIYHIRHLDRTLIGWGINPRGAVELVIANLALSKGLITQDIFSAVVTMAIICALVAPVMFRRNCVGGIGHIKHKAGRHHHHHKTTHHTPT